MNTWTFDLQRFAESEGEGDSGAAEQSGEDTQDNAETQDTAKEYGAGGTLLGAAGEKAPEGQEGKQKGSDNVPESYDFTSIIPDGMEYDESSAQEFSELAKKAGLTQAQAGEIAAYGMAYMKRGQESVIEDIKSTMASWGEEAKRELGTAFDTTLATAKRGLNAMESRIPGLGKALDLTGAGNRVEIIRLLAEVGKLTGEDGGQSGESAGGKSIYPNTDFDRY
ncbi:hypothetical protein TAMA11512_12930 [Selenomonas sp. TAMA-11512]|uniref:hypothetical protein n=1 Tax=Selenomonas sp. TAMA-11512 TaxID=3095337 RepID=UPI00308E97FC|nr:hypothetical protein TAMA11512_12930 [Selenomonas sp. TAMA-11512]